MISLSDATGDPTRRSALLNIKLRALVREHLGRDALETGDTAPVPFGRGAAIVVDGTAWVLLDEQPQRGLGAALAWFSRQPAAERIAVIADSSTGMLQRRAELFETPITVWHAAERLLLPAVAEPYVETLDVDPAHQALRELIIAGGAEPLVEHGVLVGEVRGLEVCRAVTDAYTGEVRLEVGVGAHDREAFLMLHGARPTVEALADVVVAVEQHRQIDSRLHPLNRFGAERFLRWLAVAHPLRIGASHLDVVDPPTVRTNIKDPVPCVAAGRAAADGSPLVAVFSTGIDLDLIPFAVDARAMHAPEAELVVVVPPRDLSPITTSIAGWTAGPTRLVAWS